MDSLTNPISMTMLAFLGGLAGPLGWALLKRDFSSLRDSHDWFAHKSILQFTSEQGIRQLSELCLPGWMVIWGCLPYAAAASAAYTTFVFSLGTLSIGWALLLVPIVFGCTMNIGARALRYGVIKRLQCLSSDREIKGSSTGTA